MLSDNLESVILTKDESLVTSCRSRFAESRVNLTFARDMNGLKTALREKPVDAVILDAAYIEEILDVSVEEAVIKLSPLLAPRIIMVLADQNIPPDQIVKLLKLGAHDVIPKPVKPKILAAQLKALVRIFARKQKHNEKTVSSSANDLVMDYPRRRCCIVETGGGLLSLKRDIRLTKIEFQLLYILLQKQGAVVTYDDFREHLWPTASSSREIIHTLHQLVANIRKKIASCPVKIENLRADGFRLV